MGNNMSDINRFTTACQHNKINTVRQLINKVDVNGVDGGGWTGLMAAMCYNNPVIVRMLLDHPNIDLGRTDSFTESTGLHMSCQYNYTECARLFLAHRKCTPKIVNMKNWKGKTAKMVASEKGHHECARIVREYCVNTATLHYNNMSHINTFVKACLSNSIDIETFLTACRDNKIDTVRQLINKVDVNAADGNGVTGLMAAMWYNYTDIVRMLLAHPNIDLGRTGSSWTGLHLSCCKNHTECVRLFLAHRKCTPDIVNIKDDKGKTAEMIATEEGHHNCAKIVREYLDVDTSAVMEKIARVNVEPGSLQRLTSAQLASSIENMEENEADIEILEQKINQRNAGSKRTYYEKPCFSRRNYSKIIDTSDAHNESKHSILDVSLEVDQDTRDDVSEGDVLRHIIVDGSNVGMAMGKNEVFRAEALSIVYDHFAAKNHKVTIFLPRSRWNKADPKDREILDRLEKNGVLYYTPTRRTDTKSFDCYDDRYIVSYAVQAKGIIVTNDNYLDLIKESPQFRDQIENRLLPFTWVRDSFLPPEDPLGRDGPKLAEFLRLVKDEKVSAKKERVKVKAKKKATGSKK